MCWLSWDKMQIDFSFSDFELAWTSFKTAVRKFRFRWQGMLQENMKHKANIAVRESSKRGSKLEKFILEQLILDGYKVNFHQELSNMTIEGTQTVKEKRARFHPDVCKDLIPQLKAVETNDKGHPDKKKSSRGAHPPCGESTLDNHAFQTGG